MKYWTFLTPRAWHQLKTHPNNGAFDHPHILVTGMGPAVGPPDITGPTGSTLEQEVITGQASGITLCCTAFSKTCSSKASVLGDGSAVRKGKIRSWPNGGISLGGVYSTPPSIEKSWENHGVIDSCGRFSIIS